MRMTPEDAAKQIAALNAILERREELIEFDGRVRVLEQTLAEAIRRADNTETVNAKLQADLEQYTKEAAFYRLMLQKVQEHEVLQPIWDDFLVALKLVDSTVEDDFTRINREGIIYK